MLGMTELASRDPFGRYLAVGVTTMIAVQAFFNISVVLAAAANQRHSAALYFLRRIKFVCNAGQRGRVC